MTDFQDFLNNTVLWTAFLAWFVAQTLKVILHLLKYREFSFERIVGTGGMPSSHTSTVCGLTTAVGRVSGLASPAFAISMILTVVVMYDATGIRRAAGEQAKVLNRLLNIEKYSKNKTDRAIETQKALKELLGHTPLEVMAGAALGIVIGLVVPV